MRMLARKNGFSPPPYLHHWIELLQSWIKLYSCDISYSIRRMPALLSSSKARGVVWMSCNRSRAVKRSRKILGHGQVVKVQNWPVKDLDPGRGWIHCVYGSDHPLWQYCSFLEISKLLCACATQSHAQGHQTT